MKKILSLTLIAILLISGLFILTGCGEKEDISTGTDTSSTTTNKEEADTPKNAYGEFAGRTDGMSDKDGLIFIKSYESPDASILEVSQKNDNVGIDNDLLYTAENAAYYDSSISVRIFPKKGTYETIEDYKKTKSSQYTWSKATIAGTEYDVFVFANSTTPTKYSDYYTGAFLIGNKVIEFSYTMYAEIPNQELGQKFFKQIVDSIELSEEFKK